jgi:hypothetical protein
MALAPGEAMLCTWPISLTGYSHGTVGPDVKRYMAHKGIQVLMQFQQVPSRKARRAKRYVYDQACKTIRVRPGV